MVLNLRQPAPGYWDAAKCHDVVDRPFGDPEFIDPFFTQGGEEDAIEFCRGDECPIVSQCLIFALVNNEKAGVWGGTGEDDRRAIRKKWPLKSGKEPRPEWRVFEPGEPSSWYAADELKDEDDDE
jgi:WhiB family transcriptional regulator, redox-sensing transcriptional regulator